MNFDRAYQEYLQFHLDRRSGIRSARLASGQGHAEKMFLKNVWWPMRGHFDDLHPEYEVRDYKEGSRYIDFAFVQPHYRVAIEIDGFGPHWRDISTWQFSESCRRQNQLVIDGWRVVRFSYDDVQDHPRVCQFTLQQLMGGMSDHAKGLASTSVMEREVIRVALRAVRPVTPRKVSEALQIHPDYAQRLLRGLAQRRWLVPASGKVRIRSYTLHPSRRGIVL